MSLKDKDKRRLYHKMWRDANRDKVLAYSRAYRESNREDMNKVARAYLAANKEKASGWSKAFYAKNKESIKEKRAKFKELNYERLRMENTQRMIRYNKKKREESPAFRIHETMSSRLRYHLYQNGIPKTGRCTFNVLGYTIYDLMEHLENKFTPDMSWDNHGTYWHIDHIKPLCKFQDKNTAMDAWVLDNLQPLTKYENIVKGGRWNYLG